MLIICLVYLLPGTKMYKEEMVGGEKKNRKKKEPSFSVARGFDMIGMNAEDICILSFLERHAVTPSAPSK